MYLLFLLPFYHLLYLTLYFGQPLVNIIVITVARHYELCLRSGGSGGIRTHASEETGGQLVSWRTVSFGL